MDEVVDLNGQGTSVARFATGKMCDLTWMRTRLSDRRDKENILRTNESAVSSTDND